MRRPGWMTRRQWLAGVAGGAAWAQNAPPGPAAIERARRIHRTLIGVDSHIDTIQRVVNEGADLSRRVPNAHADLPRLIESGMKAPFFALYVPTYYRGSEAVRRTLQLRDAIQRIADTHPKLIEIATTAAEVRRIAGLGKVAAVLTIEGGHQIADELAVLRVYHRLGVRSMTLVHFRNNNWADSSTDQPRHNGLTGFGRDVVREMNRIGMIVDISHVSDKTFRDAMAVTSRPVIASHSSCRALSDFARNMTDDMIRAVGKNGGVVGINFGSGFLSPKDAAGFRQRIAATAADEPALEGKALDEHAAREWVKGYGQTRTGAATLDDAVRHIEHVVKLAGVDHVGIGSDFDGIGSVPAGLEDVSKMPLLTAALLERGVSEADARKILGENFLRVMRAVIGG